MHYLPWIRESEKDSNGFVCLFRQIHSLDIDVIDEIKVGIESIKLFPKIENKGELTYLYSQINSPDIEFIIQRFSSVFQRVGVNTSRFVINDVLENELSKYNKG